MSSNSLLQLSAWIIGVKINSFKSFNVLALQGDFKKHILGKKIDQGFGNLVKILNELSIEVSIL